VRIDRRVVTCQWAACFLIPYGSIFPCRLNPCLVWLDLLTYLRRIGWWKFV